MKTRTALTTVVSYPERGPYGDSSFRGNCSGLLIKDLFQYYKPRKVLDPMEGSGTCRDVCRKLNIPYAGTDLSRGIDMFSPDFISFVNPQRPIDFIFWHPPYADMIKYSTNPRDLSNMPPAIFRKRLIQGAQILYDLVCPDGHLVILIGTKRWKGKIFRFNVNLINWKEPTEPEIIKVQHNCDSNSRSYSGKFIPILDERILIWKKPRLEGMHWTPKLTTN